MGKIIDFSKTVYEICKETPEVISVMRNLGFESITNPTALMTVGRFMTIPKGAAMKDIDINEIKAVFIAEGFVVVMNRLNVENVNV